MNKLKDLVELIGDDGDIIAIKTDTLLDSLPHAGIAGSTDCFYTMNLDKGKYILFKAIDEITIDDDGDTND